MEFLVERFSILGFEFQIWMPIFIGAVMAYAVFLWKTGRT
jgi:hypothetical protein